MPDLNDLPDNSSVFVDTNIFDYALRGSSRACADFIERIARGKVKAYVNTHVLADLMHKLMLQEAYKKTLITAPAATKLKDCFKRDRTKAAMLVEYQQQFENLLAIGLRVLPVTTKLMVDTRVERATHALLTGDSLHIGSMNYHQVKRKSTPLRDLVTNDRDFAAIHGITVWEPTDVVL